MVASLGMLIVLRDRPREERLGGGHHPDVAGVMDQPLCRCGRSVGGVEHRQMLVLEVGSAFDGLLSADPLGRLPDLVAGEPERPEQVELERGVLVDLESESLHRRLAEDERVEGVPELEHRRQCRLDLGHVLVGEALVHQRLPVDVGSADQRAGPDDVLDDVLDLLVVVAEVLESGRHRLVDDLEVAAAGQLLELDQREVGLDPGGVAVHLQADGPGGSDDA